MKNSGFVLDLKNRVGGYSTTAAVVSALQSDGHGGIQLLLSRGAGAPKADFVNIASSLLTSAHF